jgi:hypothetical protein
VGVAWYGPEQWSRLRKVADDPEALEETYAEWLAVAENAIRDLKKAGVSIEKVPIDTEELVAWCNANGRSINGEARAAFAGELLQRKHEAS